MRLGGGVAYVGDVVSYVGGDVNLSNNTIKLHCIRRYIIYDIS